MLFAKEILITVEESKGGEGLDWKVVFLALLLVSTVAVTVCLAVGELHVVSVLDGGFRRVADPTVRPTEAIDDENPPG